MRRRFSIKGNFQKSGKVITEIRENWTDIPVMFAEITLTFLIFFF